MEGLSQDTNLNKITRQLNKIRSSKAIGLMTHIVVGYPNLGESQEIVKCMIENGADFIELQIPFSDPMADGPTIMKANKIALDQRTSIHDALNLMRNLTQSYPDFPFLFMTYFNIIHKYGVENFCQDAAKAGCSGLIIPDIPLEEEDHDHFMQFCNATGLYGIRLLAPISTDKRIQLNAEISQGFIYFSAKQGITGAGNNLDPQLIENLKHIKALTNIPLAVGFGISEKRHIEALQGYAEIAVVGSALIDVYNQSGLNGVQEKLRELISTQRT